MGALKADSGAGCTVSIIEFSYWFVGQQDETYHNFLRQSSFNSPTPGVQHRGGSRVALPPAQHGRPPCGSKVFVFPPGKEQLGRLHTWLVRWRIERWQWIRLQRRKAAGARGKPARSKQQPQGTEGTQGRQDAREPAARPQAG